MLFSTVSFSILAVLAAAADSDYTVVGSFIFGRHNDRSAKPATVLTPLGASSQFESGQFYRERYFAVGNDESATKIAGLNQYGLFKNGDIYCEAISSNVILFSHYSFLQGLYPPTLLDKSEYLTYANQTLAWESNGTLSENPLNGYQYVNSYIQENATDGYINIKGDENCPAFDAAVSNVVGNNAEFKKLVDESSGFYDALYEIPFIKEMFPNKPQVSFVNAMSIFDEVNVNCIHNSTVAKQFNDSTLDLVKYYSDQYQWLISSKQINTNLTMGAQSLINAVSSRLNITKTQGKPYITYFTGSFNTMYQLASLLELDTVNPSFKTMPNYGATYVFELLNNTKNESFVRFSFKNGTSNTVQLTAYPIFNKSESVIPWSDFIDAVRKATKISSVPSWCNACGFNDARYSHLILDMCVPYTANYKAAATLASKGADLAALANGNYQSLNLTKGLSLVQAGGIGAATTIGVFALLALFGFLGYKLVRKHRKQLTILPTSSSTDDGKTLGSFASTT